MEQIQPDALQAFLVRGGPALWAIAALSVAALAVTLWKVWTLYQPFGGDEVRRAVDAGRDGLASDELSSALGGVPRRAISALQAGAPLSAVRDAAEAEARAWLASLTAGTRILELTVVIAPLLGLLGTVLGMIEAFRALEEAGARADPSLLAGGIWEALLTTAAGMAVAIPASVALSWIESRRARIASEMETTLTRLFLAEASR